MLRRDLLRVGIASLAIPVGTIAKRLEGAVTQPSPSHPASAPPIYFNYDGKVFVVNTTKELRDDIREIHCVEMETLVDEWTAYSGRIRDAIYLKGFDALKDAAPQMVPIDVGVIIFRWKPMTNYYYTLVPSNRIMSLADFHKVRAIML